MELKFDPRQDLIVAFPTRICRFLIDGAGPLNEALEAAILERKESSAGVHRSNIGGWHSNDDFLSWPDRGVDTIKQAVQGALQTMVPIMVGGDCSFDTHLVAWANVSGYGHFNKRHNHPDCQVSAVYYVRTGTDVPEIPQSGLFELFDPRIHAEMSALPGEQVGIDMQVKPVDGMLLMFPSWMYHQVYPYYGEGNRISIAINAHIHNLKRSNAPAGNA